jgi:hypothetical protein
MSCNSAEMPNHLRDAPDQQLARLRSAPCAAQTTAMLDSANSSQQHVSDSMPQRRQSLPTPTAAVRHALHSTHTQVSVHLWTR